MCFDPRFPLGAAVGEADGISHALRFPRKGGPAAVAKIAPDEPFQMIFADPPYGYAPMGTVLETIAERALLGPGGLLILENDPKIKLPCPAPFTEILHRIVGPAGITIFTRRA